MADIDTHATAKAGSGATAGAKLRAAREAAGLSIDAVAQQLKLAPRQVTALEEDDWHRLPGRTFVRGFARNYARFVHLDPDAVLALLPAADAAPALSRPTLAASPRPMGEIPAERVAKPSAARWLVPLLLLVVVAGVGYYELSRPTLHWRSLLASIGARGDDAPTPTASAPGDAPPPSSASEAAPKAASLPNPAAPVADATPTSPATAADASSTPAAAAPAAASGISVLPTPKSADATPATDATAPASPPPPAAAAADGPLVLTFKGTSWAEVKDAKGRVVLQMTGGAGMTQTVTATPPLELSLGNAREVAVTFRGQALDLSAYTRGNVARVSLQ